MVSQQKLKANRSNAKKSTGPRDTSKTRFNALRHGILSRETLIVTGNGQEDVDAFEDLCSELRVALAPNGALEDLLVEELIVLTWR